MILLLLAAGGSCANSPTQTNARPTPSSATPVEVAPINSFPVIHVFVALADNVNQGIVPVSASLGNGDNPKTNLYWGAAFGIRTFFSKSKDWELISVTPNPSTFVLERCIFKHRRSQAIMVADAYRGKEISQATWDFLEASAGKPGDRLEAGDIEFDTAGSADLIVYIGHNGLMDFTLHANPRRRDDRERQVVILACASKPYFTDSLKQTGAKPLLWTTNLMAPEAYVLSGAIDGWLKKESDEEIRTRAAVAYDKYQKCGLNAAKRLFAAGW